MENTETPANIDAERSLIGLTLVDGRIPSQARDLSVTDFFSAHYRIAWSAFLELEENGNEIEALSAAEIMRRNGGTLSVFELTATATGMLHLNAKIFVDKIKEAAQRRFVMRELCAAIERVQNGDISLDSLRSKLGELEITNQPTGNFKSLATILQTDVKPALYDLRNGINYRISTGFDKIDNAIGGGFSPSDVVVVAAQTGAGKSAFVLQLAANIARQEIPVAFISGEMSNRENGLRLLSQASGVWNLNSATHIDQFEHDRLTEWADHLKQFPIYFDSTTFDLQNISRSVRNLVQSVGVRVLVIDYLQLFKLSKTDRLKRTERISEVSQEVKRLAMELGIAVIEVVQFNREGAKSVKSSMHDLDGSSQLEKDASLIFILDRENDGPGVRLRLVKGRNTGKCEIDGTFGGRTLNFEF